LCGHNNGITHHLLSLQVKICKNDILISPCCF
jgi:hypothetical protein